MALNDQKIPGLKSYIRVNTDNKDDLNEALNMVPDEDRISVGREMRLRRGILYVVLSDDDSVIVVGEQTFESTYLNADEGVDEEAPIENGGESHIYELTSDASRGELSRWATQVIPGSDTVLLQQRVAVGDIVLVRPNSGMFEVFKREDSSDAQRQGIRLQCLHLATQTPVTDPLVRKSALELAKEYDTWVHGA